MSLVYINRLGFKTQKTNIRTQKINGPTFKNIGIIIAYFQIADKVNRPRFF